MAPPGESLDADDLTAGQVDARLVVHCQLVAGQSPSQLDYRLFPGIRPRRSEDLPAAATVRLRRIHRLIGAVQRLIGVDVLTATNNRNPHARHHGDLDRP